MAAEAPGDRLARVFQERLNLLVARSARQGAPVSNAEVARWMTEHGFPITPPALSMLRNRPGARPALRTIEGLAAFFAVDPAVLLSDRDVRPEVSALVADPQTAPQTEPQTGPRADPQVEAVAVRAVGLSSGSLVAVRALLDQLRANEGLPPVSG